MEKTKLGLSANIMSVIVFLLFLFGGYTVGLLVFGYVLLCEKDQSLRVSAVTALLVALAYSLIHMAIGLIPSIVNIFDSLLMIFKVYLNLSIIDNAASFLYNILSLLRTAAYVVLAIFAFVKKPIQLGFVKKLVA